MDLNAFIYTDGVEDVLAQYINNLLANNLRGELTNVESLAADKTLIDADLPSQFLDPNGANRVVKTPTKAASNHVFFIVHTGSANTITVKNSTAAVTLGTLSAGQVLLVISGGATVDYKALNPNLVDASLYLLKSGLTEWDEQGSDPSTPATNKWKLYFKSGGLYLIDDAGVVTGPLGSSGGGIYPAFVRCSVVSGVPNPTADYSAQTAIYAMPRRGNTYPQWNGSAYAAKSFTEQTLTLNAAHTSGSLYDCYLWDDSGTQRFVTGPAWSSSTSRGTGAGTAETEVVNGVTRNKVQMTVRNGATTYTMPAGYGTVVATIEMSANGQVNWTAAHRCIYNFYNQDPAELYTCPGYNNDNAGTTYTISATTWVEANGGTGSRTKFVLGQPAAVHFNAHGYVVPAASGVIYMAIGLDTTSSPNGFAANPVAGTGEPMSIDEDNKGIPLAIGTHYAALLFVRATANCTIYADQGRVGGASADNPTTFLSGQVLM